VINEPIYVSLNNGDSLWQYTAPQLITSKTSLATARFKGTILSQKFSFNKATGKRISLVTDASKGFPGDGAFTLVNGVQNEKALSRSREFLGFAGKDMEAVIDLGQREPITTIILHAFEQTGSWIYRPQSVSFYTSENGTDFNLLQNISTASGKRHLLYEIKKPVTARYIKVLAKNMGTIPSGKPGAGNPAWLFVDEIEVK
jgi:hexosaminidase